MVTASQNAGSPQLPEFRLETYFSRWEFAAGTTRPHA